MSDLHGGFDAWFDGSHVVDADGNPLVLYHGTTADLDRFDLALAGADGVAYSRPAIFATSSPELASDYALNKFSRPIADAMRALTRFKNENPGCYDDEYECLYARVKAEFKAAGLAGERGEGANVLPVYVSLKNPLVVDAKGEHFMRSMPQAIKRAVEDGFDGLIVRSVVDHASPASEFPADVYVAFRPEQLKSALGNNGQYDPNNPDIRFSVPARHEEEAPRERFRG